MMQPKADHRSPHFFFLDQMCFLFLSNWQSTNSLINFQNLYCCSSFVSARDVSTLRCASSSWFFFVKIVH